jgi:organic hydroperoxide reductase OsmC/OhrA
VSGLVKILYTAETLANGGREGRARTTDGRLVDLDPPRGTRGRTGHPSRATWPPRQLVLVDGARDQAREGVGAGKSDAPECR